jgi:EthD domain
MAERHQQVLVAAAWTDNAAEPQALGHLSEAGWRIESVLADQTALDRAGSRGRTPPPFQALLWREVAAGEPLDAVVPDAIRATSERWAALRLRTHPAWDDTTSTRIEPQIKQVSLLKAQPDLTRSEFTRHFREHVDVARVHHPAICRYVQHDVVETAGEPALDVQGVSELWFADEPTLVDRYFASPESVAAVRADNREYIDFSGTLSLLVRPVDASKGSS